MQKIASKALTITVLIMMAVFTLIACSSGEPATQPQNSAEDAASAAALAEAEAAAATAEAKVAEAEAAAAEAEAALAEAEASAGDASAEELEAAKAEAEAAKAEAEAAKAEAEAAEAAAAEALASAADTSAVNPYAKYEGTNIVVSWPALSHFEKAKELIPEFEAETGITVEVDSIQYLNMHDKQVLEMSKPDGGDYDVVAWVVMWKTEYVNKGLLAPLAPFITDAELADPTYDAEDIVPAFLINGGTVGGRKSYLEGPTSALYGIPFGAETSILAYRKDIFEENNLEVPTTYDELIETAQFITDNVEDVYGFTSRGAAGHQINAGYLLHLSPYGGTVLDDQWNPVFNDEKGLAAAEAFQTLLDNSPPGVLSYGYGEMSNAFLQGEAAMYLDSHKIAALTRDPNQSRVDGKVGFALHPTAETCGSETGGFAMGIPANAKNKEAAFLFIQWMTSKETDRKIAEIGGDPMRLSTYANPELQAKFPEYPVVLEQLECAATDWRPLIAEWGEINVNVMGVALSEAMSGEKELQVALDEAAEKTRDVLARAGYYTTEEERYQPYAGTELVVSWPALAHFEKAKELIPEFEELTGINVEVDSIQYLNMHDKQVLEMSKPDGGDYDVVAWVVMWKTEYVNKNLLQELAPFYTKAELADPTYDPEDVVPAFMVNGGMVGGRKTYLEGPTRATYGIPFGAETSILAYRTDIFDKHGLEVPTTYDELIETAQFITENEEDVYGFTSRGATGHQINAGYLLHLSPYDGTVLDDQWNPVFNNEKGVAAAVAFQKLLENSPPGVLSYGYGEMSNAFLQGEAAMYLDSHKIAAISRDPNQSKVDGNVGYALHPVQETCGSETGGFAMGIPANAKNPEAAFLFIQWLTSKEQDVKLAEIGGDPMRLSTYANPDLQAKFPEYPVVLEQLECANTDWRPLIAEWGEINVNVMGVALSEAMSGEKGIQEAMDEAADRTRDVMNRAGYYTWTRYKSQ